MSWPRQDRRETERRREMGRCESCAERTHECSGDCNCPVPRCVDRQSWLAGARDEVAAGP